MKTAVFRRKRNQALAISLAVHAIFAGLILFCLHVPATPLQEQMLIEVSPATSKSSATAGSDSSSNKQTSTHRVRIQNLGIRYGWQGHVAQTPLNSENLPENSNAGPNGDGSSQGQAQSELALDKELPLYRYVYHQINSNLAYPLELASKQMTGSVTGTLSFTEEGEFVEERSSIRSDSSYLKVAVLRAVRRAFKEPVPSRFNLAHQKFQVSAHFVFEIVEHEDATLIAKRGGLMGRELAFYRSFQKSILEWQLGPLSGLGPVPSLDLTWFPRVIGDLLSKKAKIDPLDSYRDDPAW